MPVLSSFVAVAVVVVVVVVVVLNAGLFYHRARVKSRLNSLLHNTMESSVCFCLCLVR